MHLNEVTTHGLVSYMKVFCKLVLLLQEVDQCISSLNLSKYENRLTGVLSGGYKRLTCFAVSLLGNPKVILLDEPTAGMDAKTRRIVWERLSAEMAKGRAVLLSTHSMDDSERLCTRLAIMSAGRLRCLGSSTHLKTKFGYGYTLRVKLHSREQVACVQEDLIETFHGGCILEVHRLVASLITVTQHSVFSF